MVARAHLVFEGGSMIDVPRDDLVLMLEAGYVYLAMRQFSQAREVFEGVIALAPTHDLPRVALANALFAQKKFAVAIRVLKEAVELNPRSSFAYAHLGEALLFAGKKSDALTTLKKSIEVDAAGQSAEFARSLIELIEQGYDPVKNAQKMS